MPAINHIHHLALKYASLRDVIPFYKGLLQSEPLQSRFNAPRQCDAVWFDLSGIILMLEQSDTTENETAQRDQVVLAFKISPHERSLWVQHLADMKTPLESQSNYSLYFRDPGGYLIALSHYPLSQGSLP